MVLLSLKLRNLNWLFKQSFTNFIVKPIFCNDIEEGNVCGLISHFSFK